MEQQPGSSDERRFVQRLLRYYLYRSIQVILQSRSGKPFRCACKANSLSENLSLSLEDDPVIANSIKKNLGGAGSSQELLRDAQSVEVFLTTNGDPPVHSSGSDPPERLFLEVWTFRYTDECDPSVRRMKAFDHLVVALKALWSVTRLLPAYRVARRHISERRLLCYAINPGASDPAVLGPGYQNRRVASVRTSAGTLALTCSFRNPVRLGPETLPLHEGHYGGGDQTAEDGQQSFRELDSVPDSGLDTVDGAVVEPPLSESERLPLSHSPLPTQHPSPPQSAIKVPLLQNNAPASPLSTFNGGSGGESYGGFGDCGALAIGIVGNCDVMAYDDDLPFQSLLPMMPPLCIGRASRRRRTRGNGEDKEGEDRVEEAEEPDADYITDPEDSGSENTGGGKSPSSSNDGQEAAELTTAAVGTVMPSFGDTRDDLSAAAEATGDSEVLLPFARDSSATDLQRLERLKSGVRLEMFAAPRPLAARIGEIPGQLKFFEDDLAEFDKLLNSLLDRDSSDSEAGALSP